MEEHKSQDFSLKPFDNREIPISPLRNNKKQNPSFWDNSLLPSIIGPPPIKKQHLSLLHSLHHSHPTFQSPPSKLFNKPNTQMDISDEELIQKFVGLHTREENSTHTVINPQTAISTKNWDLCLLVRVYTDRLVFAAQFEKQMRRVWNLNPWQFLTRWRRGYIWYRCRAMRNIIGF